MKKAVFCLILLLGINCNNVVFAHHCGSHIYLTHRDYYEEEIGFANCKKHYVIKGTNVYYYSNGTRRSYSSSTIFNEDGSILESNCKDVKHIISDGKHYFTFYKNKKYNIIDENGVVTSVKNYKSMQEIAPAKLLVKLDKKLGVIDINEKNIVPIKYKKFEKVGEDLFLTKLNGYYGMINSSNKTIIKNEYDKISLIYNCFLLKKEGKYALANAKGELLYKAKCKNIKKLGEYIIVKIGKKEGVLDADGNIISNIIYKDIRLNRNTLEGKLKKDWINLIPDNI